MFILCLLPKIPSHIIYVASKTCWEIGKYYFQLRDKERPTYFKLSVLSFHLQTRLPFSLLKTGLRLGPLDPAALTRDMHDWTALLGHRSCSMGHEEKS